VNTVVCAQTVDGVSLAKGLWTSCALHTLAIWLLHFSAASPDPEVWPSGRIQNAFFYPCPSNKSRVSHPALSKVTIVTTYLLRGAVFLEKLTGSKLVEQFPAFYETRRIITEFISVRTCPSPEP